MVILFSSLKLRLDNFISHVPIFVLSFSSIVFYLLYDSHVSLKRPLRRVNGKGHCYLLLLSTLLAIYRVAIYIPPHPVYFLF